MKKITILALHLGYGGIEKSIASLVNSLSKEYEVNIVSTYKLYDKPAFKINDSVKIEYLIENMKPVKKEIIENLKKGKIKCSVKQCFNNLKILKLKKQLMINYIKKCDSDIIISTRDIHNLWLGKYAKKNVIKIGWEHNHHNDNNAYINKVVSSVENLDYLVLVAKNLKEFYEKKCKCKCIYIPNTLDEFPNKYASLEEKSIISVGRLSKEKGFEDLIEVFKMVNDIYPDWHLNIIGDGVMKKNIEEKIKKLNLTNSVTMHGFRNKEYINECLFHSSIYVMPSFTESFGIVLLEAFSYGLPCIAFTRAIGATEIISNNWDGYLIKDSSKEQMAKKICELIKNPNRRIIMGANALKKANKYDANEIKKEWIKIIEK